MSGHEEFHFVIVRTERKALEFRLNDYEITVN